MNVIIRRATEADFDEWFRMRLALWPDADKPEYMQEMQDYLSSDDLLVLVAQDENSGLVAFSEVSIRSHAEGCYSRNVGYLEGWYVKPESRKRGVGSALVREAENWARSKGCVEMASDCELDNGLSLLVHLSVGYEEVERAIHFRKAL